ncbi:hypothetical protein, partial [Streptomyces griseoluteus]|uniref:hypothetical protein n=1 Tax=Streptomyces griseoluteus TaxID=29306 RepID=UPI003654C386
MPAIDWSGTRKNPARVWTAGKETRKRKRRSENLESTEEIGSEKDLIESETPKGSPEESPRG